MTATKNGSSGRTAVRGNAPVRSYDLKTSELVAGQDPERLNNMKRASWTSDETAGRCENEARSAGRSSDKLSVAHIKFGQLR
ncbi:hypothetical protein F2Q69_00017318 [Brassica cretica]|uniref:Uncharacterized protein n=1 Tax=Brassica cretica TaxID=69181 RepID=A0A8S9R415_BRACR|nr:hypothetical protein F2Q69_00017318 [Brassica cretica]